MADRSSEEKPGVSLLDGKLNYKRKPQDVQRTNTCSASRLWIFFAVFFFLTTVLAIGAFVWRNSFYEEPEDNIIIINSTATIIQRYSGFFRTNFQQADFVRQVFKLEVQEAVKINKTGRPIANCSVSCVPLKLNGVIQPAKLQATLGSTHYHACCISETYFISPETLPGLDNQIRQIVHFDDDDQRQYFQSQECSQARGCTGCQCTQTIDTHTALIEDPTKSDDDDDKYVIELVKIPGCCKCLNN